MFCFTSKSVASLLDLILPSLRISSTTERASIPRAVLPSLSFYYLAGAT